MKKQRHLTHLYWRAGFGLSPQEWVQKQHWSKEKAVKELFRDANNAAQLNNSIARSLMTEKEIKERSEKERKELRKKGKQLVHKQSLNWINRMASTKHSALLERISLFWHDHFACTSKLPMLAHNQLQTIRDHALGNFREMVHAISRDVSMIRYLNNQQNKKGKPNENFARELMELFTIGRGHYTEKDIKESAKAFTGWSSNLKGEFVFKKRQHDFGNKNFMGVSGDLNGEDIVNILLNEKQTSIFITTKIYKYFVNQRTDERRIRQLADRFFKSDYDIGDLMKTIFSSDWFYDEKNIGTKIKSPVELMAGILRQLQVDMDDAMSMRFIQKALGQSLFDPPNVAGWPGGKSWIDNSTLMLRLNLVNYLYGRTDVNFQVKDELKSQRKGNAFKKIKGHINFEPILSTFEQGKQESVFNQMSAFLLQTNVKPGKDTIDPFTINSNTSDYIKSLALRLMSLPEYQVC